MTAVILVLQCAPFGHTSLRGGKPLEFLSSTPGETGASAPHTADHSTGYD